MFYFFWLICDNIHKCVAIIKGTSYNYDINNYYWATNERWRVIIMAGTAVLYRNQQDVIVFEDVEKETLEEIKEQCDCQHCNCTLNNKKVDLGNVKVVGFKEDKVDWDYGY